MAISETFRILIADDNFLNRRVLEELLKTRGYSVHAVNDGIEVIRALESGSFDLLILDCLMPGMDGYTVSRTIRAADRSRLNPEIPILALTALASEEVRERCLQAGMDDYISKPFVAETLFQSVRGMLQQKSASDLRDASRPADDILKFMSARVGKELLEWQVELEEHLARQAFEDIRLLAHKIRGTADLLEWRELSKLCARLERVAESRDGKDLAARVTDVVDALGRCLKTVHSME